MAARKAPSGAPARPPAPPGGAAALHAAHEALLATARRLEREGRRADAIRALDAAPEEARLFGTWHLARGTMLSREGRLEEGIASLRAALEREPRLPEVLASLGVALLEKARAGAPRPVEPTARGKGAPAPAPGSRAAPDLGVLSEATRLLERARKLAPELSAAIAGLALAHRLAGRDPAGSAAGRVRKG